MPRTAGFGFVSGRNATDFYSRWSAPSTNQKWPNLGVSEISGGSLFDYEQHGKLWAERRTKTEPVWVGSGYVLVHPSAPVDRSLILQRLRQCSIQRMLQIFI